MSTDILGDAFDIHGGGIDLIFPHHENEIAQSEGAGKKFAKIWMHNGLLTIDNEKMAKSLGNFISIKDFLKRHKDPDYLKLLFLNTHYRHPVDYTEEKITEMKAQKERFLIFFDKISRIIKEPSYDKVSSQPGSALIDFRVRFEEAMDDDFNTPVALAALFDLVTHVNRSMQDNVPSWLSEACGLVSDMGKVLGLILSKGIAKEEVDEEDVLQLIHDRDRARKEKDFKAADVIRKKLLTEHGVILEDTKEGTVWRKQI
jgi:cysteinyl-tRNA synthetase